MTPIQSYRRLCVFKNVLFYVFFTNWRTVERGVVVIDSMSHMLYIDP